MGEPTKRPEVVEAHGEICATDPCQACELEALRNKCALFSASLKKADVANAALVEALGSDDCRRELAHLLECAAMRLEEADPIGTKQSDMPRCLRLKAAQFRAALIVRAVNAHEELIGLLRLASEDPAALGLMPTSPWLEAVRAALSKAGVR